MMRCRLVLAFAIVAMGCDGLSVVGGLPGSDGPADAGGLGDVGWEAGPAADAGSLVDAAPIDAAAPTDGGPSSDQSPPTDVPVAGDVAMDIPVDVPAVPVDTGLDLTPVTIDTVAPPSVPAGSTLFAACILRSRDGNVVPVPAGATTEVRWAPSSLVRTLAGVTIAAHPGTLTATCVLSAPSLADATPSSVVVTQGAPSRVLTTVDHATIPAGGSVTASCSVVDSEGNVLTGLPSAPTVSVMPSGSGNSVVDHVVTLQRAGDTAVACAYPGAMSVPATVTVTPLGAVSLGLYRSPFVTRYAIGQLIIFDGVPMDRYGNAVPGVPVSFRSDPPGVQDRGLPNHLRYVAEGDYAVYATATGEGGVALTASTAFRVDDRGPRTQCVTPAHGAMINAVPGTPLVVTGTARDYSGIDRLVITTNADPTPTVVHADASGNWTYTLPSTRFGINYIDIQAFDGLGNPSIDNCAFLVANTWNREGAALPGTLGFFLGPAAMDDGAPYNPITSLDDLLASVVNSAGFASQIDMILRAQDPLYDNQCLTTLFGFCVGSATVHYTGLSLAGPNSTDLQLLAGGVRMTAHFRNVRVNVRIDSTLGTFPGAVVVSSIDAGSSFDVGLVAGLPSARLRAGSTTVSVGSVSLDIPSLDASLVSIVNSVASGTIRTALQTALTGVVQAQFGGALQGVFGSLDVHNVGGTFPVRGFDGMTTVNLGLTTAISALDVTTARFRLGISTAVTGPTGRTTASLGVAIPPGSTGDPALTTPAMLDMHLGLFNQLLHAMWRAGLFDTVNPGVTLVGFNGPLTTSFALPPVASFASNGDVLVDLGAMDFSYGGVDPPLVMRIGVRLRSTPTTDGATLQFGTFTLDEMHFALRDSNITSDIAAGALVYLRPYLQEITGGALSRALPSIPLPSFAIPSGLAAYGLPSGLQLGITHPVLGVTSPYFVFRGAFGALR